MILIKHTFFFIVVMVVVLFAIPIVGAYQTVKAILDVPVILSRTSYDAYRNEKRKKADHDAR